MEPTSRHTDLDWLRLLCIAGVLIFHCAMPFATDEKWHVRNAKSSNLLLELVVFMHLWRMPLLFFVSGAVSFHNYVVLHLPGRRLITHSTLQALLARLPAGPLVQTHKSYAVAPAHIDSLAGSTLHLGPDEVLISKLLRAQVLAQLGLGGT